MRRPKTVKLVEVGPRDGLQNEKLVLATADKFAFIQKLHAAGLSNQEVTSFVRSDRIAQMVDSAELYEDVKHWNAIGNFYCLIPNVRGLELALKSQVQAMAFFTATSETFNRKNINRSVDESLNEIKVMAQTAQEHNLDVRGYISTSFGCPYEGDVAIDQLKQVIEKLLGYGIHEISLGDTIGIATPGQVEQTLYDLLNDFDAKNLALHFHDTRGMALANIMVGLEAGVATYDSSAAGLGGCPYAKSATGNVATEEVVLLLNSLGIQHGVDLAKLKVASAFILQKLGKTSSSKYLQAVMP